jgi:hypothetical protein
LLGLLLAAPNSSLSSEQAAEALMPEAAPAAGATLIQQATSKLRR